MLSSGCFSRPAEEPPPEVVQPSPAQRAQEELAAIQARLNAMPMPDRNTLRGHGALLSRSDATARAAVTLAQELRQSLLSAPAMQTDGDLAATAPRLAARVASLRDALDVHSALLRSLTMIPLPPADPAMEGEEPVRRGGVPRAGAGGGGRSPRRAARGVRGALLLKTITAEGSGFL
jgi:hypothetical protein